MAKIYNRVGFNELARVEAIKSLNSDYSNYSAHFLLGNIYNDSNLNSNAQTTQNLIGRLLVPVNYNSNAVDLVGSEASQNEYTSLFNRPVNRTKVTGSADSATEEVAGSVDRTYSNNKLGLKVGVLGVDRNGFRQNDYTRQKQAYLQGQYQLLENDTLIFDGTVAGSDKGDVTVTTDPYEENKDVSTSLDSGLVRTGLHHSFSQNSHLVGQAYYNRGNFTSKDPTDTSRIQYFDITNNGNAINNVPFPTKATANEKLAIDTDIFGADLQYILDTELVSFIVGTSLSETHNDGSDNATITGIREPLSFLNGTKVSSNANVNESTQRAFVYSKWHPTKRLNFDLGVTYANLKLGQNSDIPPLTEETYKQDAFDPQLGAVLELTDDLTLRAAYTQSIGRLANRGTIGPLEPTFVGGFNQLSDGIRGSSQELSAIGLDAKLPMQTYLGTSYQHRDISLSRNASFSYFNVENGELTTSQLNNGISRINNEAKEDQVGAYLYKIITSTVSATANYDWNNLDQSNLFADYRTNRLAFNLRYFDPSGFFAFGKSTWRGQDRNGNSVTDASDSFWVWDAGVGYEFDKYHGFVSLEFRNLFNQDFKYSAIRDESFVIPEFGALLKASYNF